MPENLPAKPSSWIPWVLTATFLVVSLGGGLAQGDEMVPEAKTGAGDVSCQKYEVKELRNAAEATDETSAHLALAHADAYARLVELSQPC